MTILEGLALMIAAVCITYNANDEITRNYEQWRRDQDRAILIPHRWHYTP
jgi:hypothetical protein